jgi:hypothetical protein
VPGANPAGLGKQPGDTFRRTFSREVVFLSPCLLRLPLSLKSRQLFGSVQGAEAAGSLTGTAAST